MGFLQIVLAPAADSPCPLCYIQEVPAAGVPLRGAFPLATPRRKGPETRKPRLNTGAFTCCPWGRGEWGARQQVTLATRWLRRWFRRGPGIRKNFRTFLP